MPGGRWVTALVGLLALGPVRASAADAAAPTTSRAAERPDTELLLNLELLRETDLTRERDLYRRLGLLERLRLLERMRLLESPTPIGPEAKEAK